MRVLLLVALIVLLSGADVPSQTRASYTLAVGRLGGTAQEIQECYFGLNAAMLILHPRGEPCQLARELVGRTGVLIFVPD